MLTRIYSLHPAYHKTRPVHPVYHRRLYMLTRIYSRHPAYHETRPATPQQLQTTTRARSRPV